MLVGQGEACARRLDLEERARTRDDRIGGRFLAECGEMGDLKSFVAPGDLAGATAEPVGPDVNLDGLHTDEGHVMFLSGAVRYGSRRPGHTADRTSVR